MKFPKSINFQKYLRDYPFWQDEHFKSRKIFKNVLSVIYGRKKDRGHIKKKYLKRIEEHKHLINIVKGEIFKRAPHLAIFTGGKYDDTI